MSTKLFCTRFTSQSACIHRFLTTSKPAKNSRLTPFTLSVIFRRHGRPLCCFIWCMTSYITNRQETAIVNNKHQVNTRRQQLSNFPMAGPVYDFLPGDYIMGSCYSVAPTGYWSQSSTHPLAAATFYLWTLHMLWRSNVCECQCMNERMHVWAWLGPFQMLIRSCLFANICNLYIFIYICMKLYIQPCPFTNPILYKWIGLVSQRARMVCPLNVTRHTHKQTHTHSQASEEGWNIMDMQCESGPPQYLIKVHFKSNPNV